MKKKKKLSPTDEKVMEFFGKAIARERERRNDNDLGVWTQENFGLMVGVSGSAIGNYERGEDFPSPAKLIIIASTLELPYDDILPRRLVQQKVAISPEKVSKRPA